MCWVHGHTALGLGTGRARATSRDAEFGRRDATSRSDRGFVRPSVRLFVRPSVTRASKRTTTTRTTTSIDRSCEEEE